MRNDNLKKKMKRLQGNCTANKQNNNHYRTHKYIRNIKKQQTELTTK